MRASMDRRIRVLVVRRRLENASATLVDRATGAPPALHSMVASRLMLLAAGAPPEQWSHVYGIARRAAGVYAATSSVLHSNRAFGDIPEHEVQEWEHVVAEVESTMQQA
jgi:hypothetical protein